jgi:hypothetical protein
VVGGGRKLHNDEPAASQEGLSSMELVNIRRRFTTVYVCVCHVTVCMLCCKECGVKGGVIVE